MKKFSLMPSVLRDTWQRNPPFRVGEIRLRRVKCPSGSEIRHDGEWVDFTSPNARFRFHLSDSEDFTFFCKKKISLMEFGTQNPCL